MNDYRKQKLDIKKNVESMENDIINLEENIKRMIRETINHPERKKYLDAMIDEDQDRITICLRNCPQIWVLIIVFILMEIMDGTTSWMILKEKVTIKEDFSVAIAFPKNSEKTEMLKNLYNKAIVFSNTDYVSKEYFDLQISMYDVVKKEIIYIVVVSIAIALVILAIGGILYLRHLRILLYTDALTKAKNRRSLFTRYDIKDYKYIYYFDIDNFKTLNDTLGHKFGDKVLFRFANCIMNDIEGDLFRIGGDEFVLLSNSKLNYTDFDCINNDEYNIQVSVGALEIDNWSQFNIDELIN